MQTADYCRAIEAYLCQKNDGHLIRVVGPSFDLVSRWAADGVPLKVAFRGIDRYFERYYRKGPRRRPVRIDSCEADVLDSFDEWRRAIGLPAARDASSSSTAEIEQARRCPSLRAHLERALARLTNARALGVLYSDADDLIDRVSRELDMARAATGGVRGAARAALIERLAALDAELLRLVRNRLETPERRALETDADEELAAFRDAMPAEAYRRAREAAIDRLTRDRLGLPIVIFTS